MVVRGGETQGCPRDIASGGVRLLFFAETLICPTSEGGGYTYSALRAAQVVWSEKAGFPSSRRPTKVMTIGKT